MAYNFQHNLPAFSADDLIGTIAVFLNPSQWSAGLPFSLMEGPVALASAAGLLVKQQGVIHTTARGHRYLNELLQYWLPEAPPDANTG